MTPFPVDRSTPIERFVRPFQEFARAEASGGIVLLVCTALALAWANSPWAESYFRFWQTRLTVGPEALEISKPLLLWVNDGLMAIFFLVVGLEIKRELLVGELSSPRKAAVPIAAALGGMIAPALAYVALNVGTPEVRGWGVPMATDIAFALGILALLGKRVPVTLKVFLAAVAIADDLGAVLVIAVFYTEDIRMSAIGVAAVTLGLLVVANLLGIRRTVVYVVLGTALWVAVLKSGVHATIAGVCLAMTIPARVRIDADDYAATVGAALEEFKAALPKDEPQSFNRRQAAVHAIAKACQYGETPLLRMEHGLVRWVAFFIVPVFAFANAGVDLQASLGAALTTGAGLGIILGLVVGKCLGITLFTWLAVRLGIGALPAGVTWPNIIGVSLIAGIGFTMSIFIAGLAFGEGDALDVVKAAILIGSFVAGILGFTVLRITTSPRS